MLSASKRSNEHQLDPLQRHCLAAATETPAMRAPTHLAQSSDGQTSQEKALSIAGRARERMDPPGLCECPPQSVEISPVRLRLRTAFANLQTVYGLI